MSAAEETARAAAPAVAACAPDFALRDTTGTERTLSELARDRLQVLIFYRGHW